MAASDVLNSIIGATSQFAYDTIEIRSNGTPTITMPITALQGGGPPNPIAQALQPTIILTGPAGQQVIAPYGASDGSTGGIVSVGVAMGIGSGLLLLGFLAGRRTERRKTRSAARRLSSAVSRANAAMRG
jgi:hypothetical protein